MDSVRRATPGPGNSVNWHHDILNNRVVAITVNLSQAEYHGGVLQIRESQLKKIIGETSNTGPRDTVLFRIAPALEHRNTSVRGTIPKIAFSGWFMSGPEFESRLGEIVRPKPKSTGRPTTLVRKC